MKCTRCTRQAKTDFPHQGPLCKVCFCKEIELRIRRQIRADKSIRPNQRLLVADALINKAISRVIKYPLKMHLVKSISYCRIQSDPDYLKKLLQDADKVLIPWNMQDEVSSYLESILLKKMHFNNEKVVKFFKPVMREEICEYARLLKISWKSPFKWDLRMNVARLENGLRGTQFSILKASEKLSEILKKDTK